MRTGKRTYMGILAWMLAAAIVLSMAVIPVNNANAASFADEKPVFPADYATQTMSAASGNNYAKLLQESLYLYDANMCGSDVDENSGFTWRTDCHTGDARISYNGRTVDLSGGYHDAGDHVKFGLPQAYSATVLGLAYYQFEDAFEKSGAQGHYIRVIDRFVEYFEKCTILDSKGNVQAFCYQVGSGNTDHSYWGAPEKQSQRTQAWFTSASVPATDIVCETAAALAIYYCNFKNTKPTEAKTALQYAEKLFSYANSNQKAVVKIETDNATGNPFYNSTSWEDDYALAAAWLYRATGKTAYKNDYTSVFGSRNWCGWVLSWDDVSAAALLYGPNASQADYVASYVNSAKNNTIDNGKYAFLTNWGSARYNAALQFMGLAYDDIRSRNNFGEWAEGQMNYLLGSNSGNHCYVIGYNSKSVKYPHHRAASGYNDVSSNATTPMKHLLIGALVGGPDSSSSSYVDSATNYATNEVALDYNAGLVAASAGLYLYELSHGTSGEKAAQVKVSDETTLTKEMRASVIKKDASRLHQHTYGSWVVDKKATASAAGSRHKTCKVCGDTVTEKLLCAPTIGTPSNTANGVRITWNKIAGSGGYIVYRKVSGGSWARIAETNNAGNLSCTDKTAVSGTTYYYTVRAKDGDILGDYSSSGKSIKYLAQPSVTVANCNTGIKISWSKTGGATGYLVYRKTSGSSWSRIATINNGSTLTYTDKVSSGTTYSYTVRASVGSNLSSYDSTGKSTMYVPQPSVSALSNVNGGVKITWSKSTGASGYFVYRKTSGGSWTRITSISNVNTLTYTDKTASSGTAYTYTVRAYKGSSISSYDSKGKSILYLAQPSISTPANLSTGIQISWSKCTGADSYFVYRKTSNTGWTRIATVSASKTSYTDTAAVGGEKYSYTVRACKGSTLSSYLTAGVNVQRVRQPAVKAAASKGYITVSWSNVTGANGYLVYRRVTGQNWTKIASIRSGSTLSYADKSAKKGTTYIYTVRAYVGEDLGPYNTTGATATTK